ncbi:hypothetical protein IMG5_093680, partial [Ichthyophthirius multifiliis]
HTCRICLCEEEQCKENPFINPCSCKGSCEYMHVSCVKLWIESKVHKKVLPFVTSYKWKNLECEVCKLPLPKTIYINNNKMSLIDIDRPYLPEQSYIIIESISREKRVSKGLHVITQILQEDVVKFGRGHSCEIRITDISVSRFHSFIKYEDDQFLIFDNNSKFGTLIRLDKNYPILQDKVAIQVGRTVMTLELQQTVIYTNPIQNKGLGNLGLQNNINNQFFRTSLNINSANLIQNNKQNNNNNVQQQQQNKGSLDSAVNGKNNKQTKVNTFIISAANNIIGNQLQNNAQRHQNNINNNQGNNQNIIHNKNLLQKNNRNQRN